MHIQNVIVRLIIIITEPVFQKYIAELIYSIFTHQTF